jgi:molecular chaperone DnaJ
MAKNYYKILGVDKGVSGQELKKVYLQLVKKYHPDVNKEPGAENKFKDIQEAYEAIKSGKAEREEAQDVYSANDDIFGFNTAPTKRREIFAPPDSSLDVEIEFLTGCLGGEVIVMCRQLDFCKLCKESYDKTGEFKTKKCDACHGSGRLNRRMGPYTMVSMTCPSCQGQGSFNHCAECGGSKYVENKKTINIKIPEGIEEGQIFKVPGGGNYDYLNKKYGDAYIRIVINDHEKFRRRDLDIFSHIDVNYYDCILGAEIEVETIRGKSKIEIPKYSKQGTVIPVEKLGVKHRLNHELVGKHYFSINIKMPDHVDSKEKKMLDNIKKMKSK